MRIGFYLLLTSAALLAADTTPAPAQMTPGATAPAAQNSLVTSKRTPTAEAPAFGTKSYFRRVLNPEVPKIELKAPVRISEFVQAGKLELSLRNYIELVLANNTDIQVQRLSVEVPRNAILRSYSIFDPNLTASFQSARTETPTNDALAGAVNLNVLNQPLQVRATQLLPTGTLYNFGFNAAKSSTNSSFANFNPAITSGMNFNFEQPLLRGRGTYLTKLPVTIAQSRLRVNEYNIQDQVLRLVNNAENAYWDVVLAREQLKVQEQNLALNDQFLKRSRRELELGAISQLDIYQPEAAYKNAELAVTQAQFRLQSVEDALRRQMAADLDPAFRDLPIILTEDLAAPVQTALDRETLVQRAISQRPDLKATRQSLDVDELQFRTAVNRLKPDFRLTGGYGAFGRGGTFYQRSNIFTDNGSRSTLINVVPGGLGDALDQLFGFGFPAWNFGVRLTLPLRDRAAAADYADAVVNKRLDMLRVRSQEQTARLDVVNAITEVERSRASIELAGVALDLAQKRLDAEQKKFDLGTTTLFFVLDAQTQYNTSKSNLVNQTVTYRRNLTTLQRVTGDLLNERGIAIQ
ncbi:MAG: TolC family protein [Bryobacteraceae bacterium]|nr:TolC family protein [Bryobacteraceae bacterium]